MSRRDQLMRSGMKLFAANGYHGTTVSDIVADSGVAQGTFYLYYEGKADFFNALLQEFAKLLVETLFKAFAALDAAKTREDFAGIIRQAVHDIMVVYRDNAQLARIALREASSLDPKIASEYDQLVNRLAEMGKEFLDIAVERELIPPQDTRIVPFCVLGMYERVAYYWLIEEKGDIDRLVEALAHFELFGIIGLSAHEIAEPAHTKKDVAG